jgi:hypothetical protein
MYSFKEISYEDSKDLILNYHYAKRMPSISFAFGAFDDNTNELVGVVSYGIPASRSLVVGVCGVEFSKDVIELNRLILKYPIKNLASQFVAWSLKQLGNKIVVSYSDTGQGHVGTIYKATNFLYTGQTKARTDKFNGVGKHSRHYDKDVKEVYRSIRTAKNRYVTFVGNKRFKKQARKALNYEVMDYPEGTSERYTLGEGMVTYLKVVETGEIIKDSDLTVDN